MTLAELVAGHSVAIVGRAGYLAESGKGAEIDAHDVVIRVNWLLPYPAELAEHVGTRTDALYWNLTLSRLKGEGPWDGVPVFVVPPKLRKQLGSKDPKRSLRPTTGVVAAYDVLQSEPRALRLYGFDGYRSQTYCDTGERTAPFAVTPKGWTHQVHFDQRALSVLLRDPRVAADHPAAGVP